MTALAVRETTPPSAFIQIIWRWWWLPFFSLTPQGWALSWGPFMLGYIRRQSR